MKIFNNTFLIRFGLAIIFLSHSLHGIFTGNDVKNFGNLFLNKIGFDPIGIYIAWLVVLSQVIGSIFLICNKFIIPIALVFIFILICGIILVHFEEGWFVVGGGRNGVEFSFLLIFCLLSLIFSNKFEKL
jgi:putative oxidoreductase